MSQPEPPKVEIASLYPSPGTVIDGKYQVERLLGEGGMGAVAKATHLLRRAPVALKFMSPALAMAPGAVERFINEGVAASQIDSDHVVKIFDVGRLPNGAPYLVMEYLEGVDLAILLVRDGSPGLPIPRAVHFVIQALRGLQVAHAAGIVHRDMKPSNVFVVSRDGEPDFVKLVDFGISKVQQPGGGANITKTNSALGTPLYMSPEQARRPRDVDHRTDLYSVAVILYELLSGRTPFVAESGEFTEILFKIFTTDPPDIRTVCSGVPDGLAQVIHRAMAREANDRYASATEFAEALAPWADERSAHVLGRMRTRGRPPSLVPPVQSIVPAAPDARANVQGADARTLAAAPSIPPPAEAPPRPRASGGTDMAASREAAPVGPPAPAPSRGGALTIAIAIAVIVASLGTGAFLIQQKMSASPAKPAETATAATTASTTPAPSLVLPPAPSVDESATAPRPSAPAPSATTSAPRPAPQASGAPSAAAQPPQPPPPPPGSARPGQLIDVKPAQ